MKLTDADRSTIKEHFMSITDVTVILPSYNTLEYTRMSYESLRKYYPTNKIIILDDGSTDGSWELISKLSKTDPNVQLWHNTTGNIIGHTCTYNIGAKMASTELITIFHSDMVCSSNYLENMLKHWKPKTVVSATRIEPLGIYPGGREKILKPFGIEFGDFKEDDFEKFCEQEQIDRKDQVSSGIFAPWLISKEDYLETGGMDEFHFSPWPEEDADWFLRLTLGGFRLIQSRDALCYHWISRGHRGWAKNGVGKDDTMFKFYQNRARRNYLRKWHTWMKYDGWRHPISHPVYNTAFIIRGLTTVQFLEMLEPFADMVYTDNWDVATKYLTEEQPTTRVDLTNRIRGLPPAPFNPTMDITLEFTQSEFEKSSNENMTIIQNLSSIIADGGVEKNSVLGYGVFTLRTRDIVDLAPKMIKV